MRRGVDLGNCLHTAGDQASQDGTNYTANWCDAGKRPGDQRWRQRLRRGCRRGRPSSCRYRPVGSGRDGHVPIRASPSRPRGNGCGLSSQRLQSAAGRLTGLHRLSALDLAGKGPEHSPAGAVTASLLETVTAGKAGRRRPCTGQQRIGLARATFARAASCLSVVSAISLTKW